MLAISSYQLTSYMFMVEVSIGDEVQCKLTVITQAPGKNEKKKKTEKQTNL